MTSGDQATRPGLVMCSGGSAPHWPPLHWEAPPVQTVTQPDAKPPARQYTKYAFAWVFRDFGVAEGGCPMFLGWVTWCPPQPVHQQSVWDHVQLKRLMIQVGSSDGVRFVQLSCLMNLRYLAFYVWAPGAAKPWTC